MITHKTPIATTLCAILMLGTLSGCKSISSLYTPPKPQIAKQAPNTISEKDLEVPLTQAKHKQKQELPPVKIGLLLPLSGKHELLGNSMLKAAQMALFDLGHTNFELIPRDTAANPQTAKQAAREAIDAGAQILLGPVFASSAKSAQIIAQSNRINMISFSTDWTVAGRNTYVMGFSPFDQVKRILDFSRSRGLTNIGTLTPATKYGDAVLSAYRSNAIQIGLNTIDAQRFDPRSHDISSKLRLFTQYDRRQMRSTEKVAIAGAPSVHTTPEDKAPYDAVFMPIGGNTARSISNLLSQYDLPPSKVKRLGTGLWDDPSLATEAAMDGAWFASPDPQSGIRFRQKFSSIYGYEPPRLTTLAYDATALAGVLARNGFRQIKKPAFDHVSITNANGFAGIDGIFRFNSNGIVERGLAVLEYKRGRIHVIDKAPTSFVKKQTYQPASTTQQPEAPAQSQRRYSF